MATEEVSLDQFQKLVGLSDAALLWLLKEGKILPEVKDETLVIDLASVESKQIIESIRATYTSVWQERQGLIMEGAQAVITEELDKLIHEAILEVQRRGQDE